MAKWEYAVVYFRYYTEGRIRSVWKTQLVTEYWRTGSSGLRRDAKEISEKEDSHDETLASALADLGSEGWEIYRIGETEDRSASTTTYYNEGLTAYNWWKHTYFLKKAT